MKNRKGFTLAELLIVVAIIAVLVAIAIPIFTAQLEKSREATDASNIRAAYAEVATAAMLKDYQGFCKKVEMKQAKAGWQNEENDLPVNLLKTGATAADGSKFACTESESTVATGVTGESCWVVYHPGTTTTEAWFTLEHSQPGSSFTVVE